MKTIWTLLGTLMAASLIAQDNTNNLPAIPPPVSSPAAETAPAATPAPAMATPAPTTPAATPVKHKKKHVAAKKKAAAPESSVTLTPGPAEVNASELVVRGQAGLKGELVTHLHKGDTVNVLEQINLAHRSADEPGQWAKISFPTNTPVWVSAKYIDSNSTVSTKKLNLRAGPGENFSVVGVVDQGAHVTQVETKGPWMKIEAPDGAYAFVAAKFLTQMAGTPPPMNQAPETVETQPPMNQQVPEQQPIITTPPPVAPPAVSSVRIVQHEGVVGSVGSLVAPTEFKLYDPDTKQDIDFLYPTSPNMDLHQIVDARVIVTGEEGIDPRWPNTPIIAIQNIQVLETNVIKRFSQGELTHPDSVIDGRAIAAKVLGGLPQHVAELKKRGIIPGLAFVRVGEDPASKVYVGRKEKACTELGIYSETRVLPIDYGESKLLELIAALNTDSRFHGILVQAPLPKDISEAKVYSTVLPQKDVDGFHPANVGKLMLDDPTGFRPCTPAGIVELLKHANVKTEGAEVVVLGRGNIVGKPMAAMLCQKGKNANATVTICHSATRDIKAHCQRADILIAAMGVAEFVKADMVKPGATVIDVGVNRVNGKLVGDVDFAAVQKIAGKITPNPGGVGPMTIAMLMQNTVTAAQWFAAGQNKT